MICGLVLYSGVAFADNDSNILPDSNSGLQGEKMEAEIEGQDDDRLEGKREDRKMKLDEKNNKFDQKLEDRKIKNEGKINEKKIELDKKREEMLKNVLEKRKEFEMRKEELKTEMKLKSDEARESLKKSLGIIKDDKKKASVGNIANIIDNANKNTETRFTNTVNSVENVLISIKSRAEKVKITGTDTAATTADIAIAEKLISDARTAISLQSAKVYTIDITDNTKVKGIMKATRDTFNSDVKSVQEKVRAARDGVKKAADSLRKITPRPATSTDQVNTESNLNTTN